MDPQQQQSIKRKLEEIEAQIHQTQPLQPNPELLRSIKTLSEQLTLWYRGLSNGGKGAVIVVGGVFALSIVSTVLNLLRLGFTLAALGVLGYVGYKLFLAPQSSNTPK